jgi:ATP-dependent DNA helicase RecQ
MLSETAAFAETSSCRRKFILHYFGEEYDDSKCSDMCDNCRHPKQKFEAKDDLQLAIKAVVEAKEKHKIKDINNILMGVLTATAKTYKHNSFKTWGEGIEDDKDDKYWLAVLRQAIVNGFLAKDIENYGIVKVTEKGHAFLKKPSSIKFTRDHDYSNAESDFDEDIQVGGKAGGGAADETLYAMLKDLVKKTAKAKALPPYVIFQETSLEEMAIQYPITIEELTKISGVGSGKAAKFGKPFIDLIKKYVEENEIERPTDIVIKSVVNKSGLKVYIIQNIDRKISLYDMAKSKNLKLPDLLTEIETIVESGTKVNINYFIEEEIDEEKQEEVMAYFKESENDSISEAMRELGENDYTEEEIRMLRIKFLSDFGN